MNSSLPGAQMKILEKIFKRKCETTVIYHVVFRQKKISKRNLNLHAPFWDISNPDLSRLNYFEWFWMVRIPNAKIVYQNPKSHFTKESTPIKRILLFPIRSENFWNFTYKIFFWYFLLSFFWIFWHVYSIPMRSAIFCVSSAPFEKSFFMTARL